MVVVVVLLDCDLRIVTDASEGPACCKSESNPLLMDVDKDVVLLSAVSGADGDVEGSVCCKSESNPLARIDVDVIGLGGDVRVDADVDVVVKAVSEESACSRS